MFSTSTGRLDTYARTHSMLFSALLCLYLQEHGHVILGLSVLIVLNQSANPQKMRSFPKRGYVVSQFDLARRQILLDIFSQEQLYMLNSSNIRYLSFLHQKKWQVFFKIYMNVLSSCSVDNNGYVLCRSRC